jgi:hypothetical protein
MSVMASHWTTGFLLIPIAWLGVIYASALIFKNLTSSGQFGDSFGMLNGLFGGLTLLGVAYAAYLENHQLKLAKREARKSGKERRRSLKIQLATTELSTLEALANAHSDDLSRLRAGGDSMSPTRSWDLERAERLRATSILETRIVLYDIRNPRFDWRSVPAEKRYRAVKHFLQFFRNNLDRFRIIREHFPEEIRSGVLVRQNIDYMKTFCGLDDVVSRGDYEAFNAVLRRTVALGNALMDAGEPVAVSDDFEAFLSRCSEFGPWPNTG